MTRLRFTTARDLYESFSTAESDIGREASATPAVGSKKADLVQQEAVISAAIGPPPGGKSVEGGTPAKASREAKSPEPAHSAPARG